MKLRFTLLALMFTIASFGQGVTPYDRPLSKLGIKARQATWHGLQIGGFLNVPDTTAILTPTVIIKPGIGTVTPGYVYAALDSNGKMGFVAPSGGGPTGTPTQIVYFDGSGNPTSDAAFKRQANQFILDSIKLSGGSIYSFMQGDLLGLNAFFVNNYNAPRGVLTNGAYGDFSAYGLGTQDTAVIPTFGYASFASGLNNRAYGNVSFVTGSNNEVGANSFGSSIIGGLGNFLDAQNSSMSNAGNSTVTNSSGVNVLAGNLIFVDSCALVEVSGGGDTIIGATEIFASGTNIKVMRNSVSNGGTISNIRLGNNTRVTDNVLTSAAIASVPGIQFIQLWDNSQVNKNNLAGNDAFLWDVHAYENCKVDSNQLLGNNCMIDMIVQHSDEELNGNQLGNNSMIMMVFQSGSCIFSNNKVNDNSIARNITQFHSEFEQNEILGSDTLEGVQFLNSKLFANIIKGKNALIINKIASSQTIDLRDSSTFIGGNVKIGGDFTPAAANLDIIGTIKVTDGTQGAGKVLTSDANGLASWQSYAPVADSIKTRSFDTGFIVSSTRRTSVRYSVDVSCSLTLTNGAAGNVQLQTSPDNSTWTTKSTVGSSNTGTLTVGMNTVQASSAVLVAEVPAGYYVRLLTTSTIGTATFTYLTGNEIHW